MTEAPTVLFVCVHNAGRSQMAAALLERHVGGRVRVRSAGSEPADRINPAVVEAMAEAGIDVLLSARRVGPTGKAYGLDMTDEMLDLARKNVAAAGVTNIEFLKGLIEQIPLPDASVDVIISNCVINLSTDKPKVFAEMHRVLKPGGRVGVSDVVAGNDLTMEQRAERGSYVGCIAGALSFEEYERGLSDAGFDEVEIEPTHEVADGMFAAIVRARKPAA